MGRSITLPEPWKALALKLGGVDAVADAMGASRRTIYNWAHKIRRPEGPSRRQIERVFADNGMEPPTYRPEWKPAA